MKHITKTTHYWLFKPTSPGRQTYFVRCQIEDFSPSWFLGYENHMGLISRIGGDLSADTVERLEAEWQAEMARNEENK